MYALPHLQAILLSGGDAVAFAQAQLSADVEHAEKQRWHPAAWCDARGRCLAVLLFNVRGDDHLDLVLPAAQAEEIAGKLKLYMLRRDVSLAVRPYVGAGEGAPLHFDPKRSVEVLDAPAKTSETQIAAWRLADLNAGMPWLGPETTGRHLPQSLGLEELAAVSYDKGCFPGQEIIARLHFLGNPPRRLSAIRVQTEQAPPPGTPIADADGAKIGEMLWTVGSNPVSGLAVVKQNVLEDQPCQVSGHSARIQTYE